MLLVALAALAFLVLSGRRDTGFAALPRSFAIVGAAWIALCVASLAWSEQPGYTLSELQREVLYGAFAFAVLFAGTRSPRDAHIAIVAIVGGTLLMGALEGVRHLMPWLPRAAKYQAAQGPFSTQIALVAPLLALVAWPKPVGMAARPAVIAALAAGLVVAGLATENRMLWIALAAGAITAFAVFQGGSAPDAHRARMLRILLATLALIALAIAASWEYKAARYYPKAGTAVESLTMDERPRVWAAALALFRERPLQGHGFGREIVGDRIERDVPPRGDEVRIRHGHNVFVDVALQLGLPGLAMFTALLLVLAGAYARARYTPAGAAVAVTGLAMLAAYVAKNLTDDFFFRPSSLTFWAVNGMLLALCTRGERPPD